MVKAGDDLHNPLSGETFRILQTAAETGGALFAMETCVPPSGGTHVPPHLHPAHTMRLRVLAGALRLWTGRPANVRVYTAGALLLVQVLMLLASQEVALHPGLGGIGRVLLALNFNFAFVYAAPLAAMVAALSAVIVRTGWVVRPLGWVGLAVVVVTLAWFAPGLGALTALLWLFVVAGALLLRSLLSPEAGAWTQLGNRPGAPDTA
jgi:hypothetical protein